MKILLLHPHDIYSAKEPWTTRIIELGKAMASLGNEVRLVYFPLPKEERGILRSAKISDFETIPFSRRSSSLFGNISKLRQHARWADVIHVQKCFPHALLPAAFWSILEGKHLHYDWDDWEFEIYSSSAPSKLFGSYLDQMEHGALKLADSLSCASSRLVELSTRWGYNKKMVLAPVGVNLKRFSPGKPDPELKKKYKLDGKILLYLGQLNGAQYAQLAIEAAQGTGAKLLVVGGGSDLERLKRIAGKDVVFTGFVEDSLIPELIKLADVAIASFENNKVTRAKSPLKVAEYLGSGKAIVASSVGEVPSMIGDAGILVPPGDAASLRSACVKLLSDDSLRHDLQMKARMRAEEMFDWKRSAEKIISCYR